MGKKVKDLKGMIESGYYPPGAEHDSRAPWNEKDISEKEVEVCVSITLSKTVKVKVSDYTIVDSGKDEDGEYFEDIDYSDCDLKKAVEEQITLPQNAHMYVKGNSKVQEDLSNWYVDDLEVLLD